VKIGVRSGEFVGVLPSYAVAKELALGEFLDLRVQEPLPAIVLGLTTQCRPVEPSLLHDMTQCIEGALGSPASPGLALRKPNGKATQSVRRPTR
jgi:hypothetical protein